jgi:RND family efflux transporter MFP subunit
MKKIINILILVALLVIIVLKLKENKEVVENRIYQYDKEKPIKVFTQKISSEIIDAKQQFTGTFQPVKEGKVIADVQGKIIKYYVDEGAKVRKGQSLVRLDASMLNDQLQQVNIQIETLEKDLARFKILADADAIPGVKLEKVQQGIKTAKSQKQAILTKISKTTIKAPFNGVVTKKFQEIGAFAAPGIPLVLLTDISGLKFTITVPEHNLALFSKGKKYRITTDTYPDLEIEGKVIRIGNKGNMSNSFPVQFEVKNTKDKKLKANMFGRVKIDATPKETTAIVIPVSATIGSEIQPQVYLVKNGKAILTNISIGDRFENKAVVTSGINEGDIIVTSGFINLFDGANVIN